MQGTATLREEPAAPRATAGWPAPADVPADLPPAESIRRVVNVADAKARFDPALVQLIVDHTRLGDELSYQAWKDILALGGAGKKMLATALAEGIAAVPDAPESMRRLFRQVDHVPEWVDWEQLNRASVIMWRNGRLVPIVFAYSSLAAGYRSYAGTKTLNFSRLLIDEQKAGTRMTETLRWLAAATTPDGMRRFSEGFKYTVRVRLIHAAVRYGISRAPKWDWEDWGLPVANTDALFTVHKIFCENVIDSLEALGGRFSVQDRKDFFALWRYFGHVIGVPAVLSPANEAESRVRSEIMEATEHAPDKACAMLLHSLLGYMSTHTDGYQALPRALVEGLSPGAKLKLSYAMMRYLQGDELCDSLDIPRTSLTALVGVIAGALSVRNRIARPRWEDDVATARTALAELNAFIACEDDGKALANPNMVIESIASNQDKGRELLRMKSY